MFTSEGLEIDNSEWEDQLEAAVGPPGYWAHQRDTQIKILNAFKIRSHHNVLEIGSGSMRCGSVFVKNLEPGRYTGAEVSPERYALGKSMLEHFGLMSRDPTLLCCDDFGVGDIPAGKMHLVWSFQVIPHFAETIFRNFIRAVGYHLRPRGKALFTVRLVEDGPPFSVRGKWLEFPTTNMRFDFIETLAGQVGLKASQHGTLGEWGMDEKLGGAQNILVKLQQV